MRGQENRILLILVVVVGGALLYGTLGRFSWEGLKAAAITLGALLAVTWSLVGFLWIQAKIRRWLRGGADSTLPPHS
jgi:hypothetical protein